MLLKSLAKYTFQNCSRPDAIHLISLLMAIVKGSGKPFQFELNAKMQQTLASLVV
jgi:hypothetical protein